ncbi:DnaK suppressor protein [Rhodopirellula maiorica SM1]|uniref:DnaK suppressor protein n=1 Tax=Rhodopirellula maiorica SM1 TaxID=1265738 RepID=M5RKL5_9BACT|nr:TraR/DksA C4-type zinc finger protein [Rhodopirellula maiorica]EMI15907.1 DnaK suppressor protein [Rhodopirellula maiorica SM1]
MMKREDQIKSLTKKLVQRRRELLELLDGELSELHNSDDAVAGDLADAAVELDYATVNSTLAEAESDELAAIQAALLRVKEGAYGRCVDCSKNIPIDRLRKVPFADKCVLCQEAKESLQDSIRLSNNAPQANPRRSRSTSSRT